MIKDSDIDWEKSELFGVVVGGRYADIHKEGIAQQTQHLVGSGARGQGYYYPNIGKTHLLVAVGIVLGGIGQGESLTDRQHMIHCVRNVCGESLPIMVQGVHTLSEVHECSLTPPHHAIPYLILLSHPLCSIFC